MEPLEEKPTVEGFYQHCDRGELMFVECMSCGSKFAVPKGVCGRCGSKNVKWRRSRGVGRLITYTVIHVPPPQFKDQAPYVVGIVELREGFKLLSLIREVNPGDIHVGMELKVKFEKPNRIEWPHWGRYFFTPLKPEASSKTISML